MMGFEEWGWSITWLPENKNVQYGMIATAHFKDSNGAIVRLSGADNAEAYAIVRADFSSQTQIAIAIKGHLVAGT